MRVWDVSSGRCEATLLGHADRVRSVAMERRWIAPPLGVVGQYGAVLAGGQRKLCGNAGARRQPGYPWVHNTSVAILPSHDCQHLAALPSASMERGSHRGQRTRPCGSGTWPAAAAWPRLGAHRLDQERGDQRRWNASALGVGGRNGAGLGSGQPPLRRARSRGTLTASIALPSAAMERERSRGRRTSRCGSGT